jgi:disulfide bond formation protein DsbB
MKRLFDRPTVALGLIAGASLAAIGAALASQHLFDMQPCPWCVLQRAVFAGMALAALVGLGVGALIHTWRPALQPQRWVHAGALLATDLLATAGMAAALWQHFVAKSSASCNLTLADRIVSGLQLDALAPEVFAPRASCADAAVDLLGLPYEFWSLGLFAALGLTAAWALVRLLKAPGAAASG